MDKKMLRTFIEKSIQLNRDEIIRIGEEIYNNPETGYKEYNTIRIVIDKFKELGLKFNSTEQYPGVKVTVDTGREGPSVAVVAELDAVICNEHPDSDKNTGAVHACGHNAQIAAMLGVLMSFLDSSVHKFLFGKVHFIAVPAEECIEIAYRIQLREKGIIKYLGGKPELLRRGFFDDVDMCVAIHLSNSQKIKISTGKTSNGCIVKNIRYIGKSSHAGGSPHEGINALYASNLGLMAINSIRETFRENEYIRVHPIITKGGDAVNAIPSDIHMETFVRGKSLEDILISSMKIDRALTGGAYAMGAKVEIEDLAGYFPTTYDNELKKIAKEVALSIVNEEEFYESDVHNSGSTDWGDISTLMPVLEINISGASGVFHGSDFKITDKETAYLLSTKFLAFMIIELLYDEAIKAKNVLEKFVPTYKTKQEYFEKADKIFRKRILPEQEYRDKNIEEIIKVI